VKVLLALEQLFIKDKPITEENLRQELDMNDVQWQRWSKDVMDLISGIPHPTKRSVGVPQVLVMVGIPGSGKSTIANQLVQLGWERVNQDEMGTRKACELRMEQSLQKGKSVVVDRCNFDIAQRRTWFKLAGKYGVTNINALVLDISPEVCKQRIAVRKDHPTIAEGSSEGIL
jgi:predicted kinase